MDLTFFIIITILIISIIYSINMINNLRNDIRNMKVCANINNQQLSNIQNKNKQEREKFIGNFSKGLNILKNFFNT